jgi:O-antigen biosynthesis protein WbqP
LTGADTLVSSNDSGLKRRPAQPYLLTKRIIDAVAAGCALVLLSPLLALSALAVRLDSPGPAIFRQRRIGLNGRPFIIYKFRTMRQGTPEVAKDVLLRRGGTATITRIGAVLRRTSLDELPQLFNVLRGDMSFVGPRPALHNQYDLIEARRKAAVDQVLPGITGYAQVMGREDLPLSQKIAYDTHYVKHMSLRLDAWIFLRSFRALFTGKGAY